MNNRPEPTEPHKRPRPPEIHDLSGLAEIHDWPELREIRDGIPPPPGPEIVRAALMRAAFDGLTPAAPESARRPAPSRRTSSPHVEAAVRGLHRAWALLAMEARLLNPAIWLASALIMAWLGPMAVLAALSLLLSVCWNPSAAIGGGLSVWALYALTATDVPVPDGLRHLWTTSPATITLAIAIALTLAGLPF